MDRQAVGVGWRLSTGARARAAARRHLAHRQSRRSSCGRRCNRSAARARVQGRVGHWPAGASFSDRIGRPCVALRSPVDGRRRVSIIRCRTARARQHDRRSGRASWRSGANAGGRGSQCSDGRSTARAAWLLHCRACRTRVQVGRRSGVGAEAHRDDSGLRVRPEPSARDRLEPRASASPLRQSSRTRAQDLCAAHTVSRHAAGAGAPYRRRSRRRRTAARSKSAARSRRKASSRTASRPDGS